MPSPSAIRAGRAFVELFADDSKLVRGLMAASTKLKAWGASLASIGKGMMAGGLAVLAPMMAAAKHFMDFGDTIAKASDRTGVAVGALTELGYAAELSGTDLDELEKGLRKMQRMLAKADDESKGAVKSLAALGVRAEDLQDLKPEEQFTVMAERIGRIADPAKRTAAAFEVFGKSGTRLLPLMKDGALGIRALREEARGLGLTMLDRDARAAVELRDAMTRLWRVLKQGAFTIGSALSPMLLGMAKRFTNLAITVNRWILANPELINQIARIATIVTVAGGALYAFAQIFPIIGGGIALLVGGMTTLATVLTWMLTPWGFAITLIGALSGALGGAVLPWGKMFDFLKSKLLGLWDLVGRVTGGIFDAIAGGRLDLIWPILTKGAAVAWTQVKSIAMEAWNGIIGYIGSTLNSLAAAIVEALGGAFSSVLEAMADIFGDLPFVGDKLKKGLSNASVKVGAAAVGTAGTIRATEWWKPLSFDIKNDPEVLRAQDELQDLLNQAHDAARPEPFYGVRNRRPGEPELDLTGKTSVAGTFAGLAVGRMGGPSRLEQLVEQQVAVSREQAAETKKQTEFAKKIESEMRRIQRASFQ